MLTDQDAARVCASSYDLSFQWDKLWPTTDPSGIYVGLKDNFLCFRGSVILEDWYRDLDAVAFNDPILGGVHAGFVKGLQRFFTENENLFNNGTIVCGHSLGAARALLMGAYMEQAGVRPRAILTFGSPLPGFLRLAEILSPVTIRSYRNTFDPVNDVPAPFYPDLPYIHPREPIRIMEVPLAVSLDPLAFHHIPLYIKGTPPTEIV